MRAEARSCRRCPLADTRCKVALDDGDPNADLVILGEAPGEDENREGRPFVGRAGHVLDTLLAEIQMTRSKVYVVNVVMCWPPGKQPPPNRQPRTDEIRACYPYVAEQLALVQPRVILALGATATRQLLGTGDLHSRLGERPNIGVATVVPTYHPSGLNRAHGRWDQIRLDFKAAAGLLRESDPRACHVSSGA